MTRRSLLVVSVLLAGLPLLLTGCPNSGKPADPWASAGGKPKVLVSFAPLYSFAANVAGPDAEVKCLLTTTGPHTHGDATAREIELYRGCDVFFINGLGLEDEADGIASKLQKVSDKRNVVNLGAKFKEDDLLEGACHHDHSKADVPEHEHGTDPHVWLSVPHAKTMVEAVRDELKRIDPAHAAGYDERARGYLARLDRLQADGQALFANKPPEGKRILSFHEALQYFGQCYGLKVIGSIQMDPGKEPTADQLDKVIKQCRNKRVRVIAVEPQFSNHTSARVVRDALRGLKEDPIDAVYAEVDPLETCDEADLGPDLYETVMRKNLAELSKALR